MDPQQVMVAQIYGNLFADHVYGRNPKGAASEIVTMNYEDTIDYYNSYYQPANGQAFCYGKQPFIDECLKELEPVLNEYEYNQGIRHQSRIEWMDLTVLAQEKKRIQYPSWQEAVDYRTVLAWVLNDQPMDLKTELAWHLIFDLLVGSPSAPIAKAIVDLNLGDDIVRYFDNSLQQWVMALGVSGIVSEEMVNTARASIRGKIQNIVNDGFPREAVDAGLNKMEFQVSSYYLFLYFFVWFCDRMKPKPNTINIPRA
jgi:hypothetical protein